MIFKARVKKKLFIFCTNFCGPEILASPHAFRVGRFVVVPGVWARAAGVSGCMSHSAERSRCQADKDESTKEKRFVLRNTQWVMKVGWQCGRCADWVEPGVHWSYGYDRLPLCCVLLALLLAMVHPATAAAYPGESKGQRLQGRRPHSGAVGGVCRPDRSVYRRERQSRYFPVSFPSYAGDFLQCCTQCCHLCLTLTRVHLQPLLCFTHQLPHCATGTWKRLRNSIWKRAY